MPPEISKLVAAVTELVSVLGESAGLPSNLSSPIGATSTSDDRFTPGKERVAAGQGLLVRFNEPAGGDRSWIKIANIFADSFVKKFKGPDFDLEEEKETVPIIIENIAPPPAEKECEEGIIAKILKFLGPVLLVIGGIAASIAAIFAGPGVLGNALNLIGKLLTQRGATFIAKIGDQLLKLGDDFIEGAGKLLGGGLKLLGIKGGGTLAKTLGGIAAKVGGFLLKAAKFLPFIGSAVSFYFAYKRFQEGDYVGMGIEIASGLLNLIPGVGWIASAIVDVVSITRDFKTTEEERVEQSGFISKMFTGIKDWFTKNGMTILKSLPFIGPLIYFWDAYQAGFTTPEGIKNVLKAFGSITGLGFIIRPAIDTLFALFEEMGDSETESTTPTKPFWQNIKDFIKRILNKLPWPLRKPLEWLGILEKADSESGPSGILNFVDNAKEIGAEVLNSMNNLGSGVKDWFVGNIVAAKNIGKGVLEKTKEFGGAIKDWFVDNIPAAKDMAKGVLEKTKEFGGAIKDWYSGTFEKIKETGSSLYEKMQSGFDTAFNSIVNAISSIPDNIRRVTEMISTLLEPVFNGINVVYEKISPIIDKILDWSPLRLFDKGKSSNNSANIQIANQSIRIESNVLVEIAQQSKNQTLLLQKIIEKMDGINFGPGPSAPAAAPQNNMIPGMESGGSISSNLSREALLPINTVGGAA